ncbi:MAG: RNA polymerase sigma factor [Mycobacteriales bacterium]
MNQALRRERSSGMGRDRTSESDHIAAARRGEAWALREIWQALSPKVQGYLTGRGVTDAEDLTSEVFIQVFERLPRFRGDEAALRTFVFSVAHARYVDHVRRLSRRGETVPFDALLHDGETASAEAEALRTISDERVREALESLSPDQRSVVLLRVVADLDLAQTAEVLGKSVGAIKSLQHRALGALRPIFETAVSP